MRRLRYFCTFPGKRVTLIIIGSKRVIQLSSYLEVSQLFGSRVTFLLSVGFENLYNEKYALYLFRFRSRF